MEKGYAPFKTTDSLLMLHSVYVKYLQTDTKDLSGLYRIVLVITNLCTLRNYFGFGDNFMIGKIHE